MVYSIMVGEISEATEFRTTHFKEQFYQNRGYVTSAGLARIFFTQPHLQKEFPEPGADARIASVPERAINAFAFPVYSAATSFSNRQR
jgi:hypothetical protein